MEIKRVKLSDMRVPERNVRIHTEQQIKEFIRSIKMFGQIRPIVLDENMIILAGNGLYKALTEAGHSEADAYIMTDLSENQKKKLMIADNKIFNLGIENLDTLNSFLEELGSDLDVPGFDEEILKTMVADADEVSERISEYGTLADSEIKAIKERAAANTEPAAQNTLQEGPKQNNHPADTNPPEGKSIICPKCGETIWL